MEDGGGSSWKRPAAALWVGREAAVFRRNFDRQLQVFWTEQTFNFAPYSPKLGGGVSADISAFLKENFSTIRRFSNNSEFRWRGSYNTAGCKK